MKNISSRKTQRKTTYRNVVRKGPNHAHIITCQLAKTWEVPPPCSFRVASGQTKQTYRHTHTSQFEPLLTGRGVANNARRCQLYHGVTIGLKKRSFHVYLISSKLNRPGQRILSLSMRGRHTATICSAPNHALTMLSDVTCVLLHLHCTCYCLFPAVSSPFLSVFIFVFFCLFRRPV